MTERDSLDDEMLADFFDMLHRIIEAIGTWTEKKNHILSQLADCQRTELEEFVSWFSETEEQDPQ